MSGPSWGHLGRLGATLGPLGAILAALGATLDFSAPLGGLREAEEPRFLQDVRADFAIFELFWLRETDLPRPGPGPGQAQGRDFGWPMASGETIVKY